MELGNLYKTLVNTSLNVAKACIEKQKQEIIDLKKENERLLNIIENLTKNSK